jgi:hypothetical protein
VHDPDLETHTGTGIRALGERSRAHGHQVGRCGKPVLGVLRTFRVRIVADKHGRSRAWPSPSAE